MLITLGVIGVVAALAMPALVANHQKQTWITGLKKNYSIFAQATQSIVIETPVTDWNIAEPVSAVREIYEYYKPYLNIVKDCGCDTNTSATECWSKETTKALNGKTFKYGYPGAIGITTCHARLADGTSVSFDRWGATDSPIGTGAGISDVFVIAVDVNGDKGPNTMGRDVFYFTLAKNKNTLVAAGVDNNSPQCTPNDTTLYAGVDCAAKVLFGGTMDY